MEIQGYLDLLCVVSCHRVAFPSVLFSCNLGCSHAICFLNSFELYFTMRDPEQQYLGLTWKTVDLRIKLKVKDAKHWCFVLQQSRFLDTFWNCSIWTAACYFPQLSNHSNLWENIISHFLFCFYVLGRDCRETVWPPIINARPLAGLHACF